MALGAPGAGLQYVAVANGAQLQVSAPAALVGLPPPLGPDVGCALLPQGLLLAELASGQAGAQGGAMANAIVLFRARPGQPQPLRPEVLALDSASGLPQGATWTLRYQGRAAQAVVIAYSDFQSSGGLVYPAAVTESVDGAARWTIHFDSFVPRAGFTDADFPVPPPLHASAVRKAGGAQ